MRKPHVIEAVPARINGKYLHAANQSLHNDAKDAPAASTGPLDDDEPPAPTQPRADVKGAA